MKLAVWSVLGKRFLFSALFGAVLCGVCVPVFGVGAVRSTLFSEMEVNAVGLTRPWFNQVMMDLGQSRIAHITLQDDTLFITTDSGRIHVIDGKTGATLWSRLLGPVEYETYEPAVNSKIVAVIHGTTLFFLDRFTGKILLETPMQAPPGAGPQASERFVYVPILTGKVFAYPIRLLPVADTTEKLSYENLEALRDNPKLSAEIKMKVKMLLDSDKVEEYVYAPILPSEIQMCPALGHPLVQPVLMNQSLVDDFFAWVSDKGWLLIGRTRFKDEEHALKLMYRISLAPELLFVNKSHLNKVYVDYQNDMNYRPTYNPKDQSDVNMRKTPPGRGGMILVGAQTGFIFAVNDLSGDVDWQFCAGDGVIDPIGLSEEHCYATTYSGSFYCVELKTGKEVWRTDRVRQFIAATASRIYILDVYGNLVALDKASGQRLEAIPLDLGTMTIFNVESDRIYLVAPDGLVQCLHEIESPEPIRYRETSIQIAERLKKEYDEFMLEQADADKKKPAENAPAAGDAPVAAPDEQAEPAASGEPEKPADSADNPFADDSAASEESGDAPAAEPDEKPADSTDEENPFE